MKIHTCDKCSIPLKTHLGIIRIIYPVFIKDKFTNYNLCRGCFIDGDNLMATDFVKWLKEGSE